MMTRYVPLLLAVLLSYTPFLVPTVEAASAGTDILIPSGATWKYYDTVTSEMPGWAEPAFNDSAWDSGPAELGYGDAPGRPEATIVGYGPSSNNRYITTYFRHSFSVADASAYKSLSLNLERDDGAVVYLNSKEIFRSNMGPGPVSINTLAVNASDDGAVFFPSPPISAALLTNGLNVVAVEIHQSSGSSSDISFDLELLGTTTNAPPFVSITGPADNAVFTAPAVLTINTSAADSDGAVTNVEFFANGSKLGEVRTAPYSWEWPNVAAGTYDLSAIVSDNYGAKATSAVVRVSVVLSTPPTIAAFAPAAGMVSKLTQVTVQFSEPVVGVKAGDLLINSIPAVSVEGANASYTFSFPQPLEGTVTLTWAANHQITDREMPPKRFAGVLANETAQYTLIDTVPPTLTQISPLAGATLSPLTRVEVTFSKAVGGVSADTLLVGGVPAKKVTGSLAGPYVFEFAAPIVSRVPIVLDSNHRIHDFAITPNAFPGAAWQYWLDNSGAETNVIISEIMYHPAPEMPEDSRQEWIELHNRGTGQVNLHGWRLTKGLAYTFTNTTLPAGGYLVVAANVAAFRARYPSVTNVVGDWVGHLANNGDELGLVNAKGDLINHVPYASQGDWASRIQGLGERQITSLTRNGNTATAFVFGHDYENGDQVRISGADQSAYNGVFTIGNCTSSTFTFSLSGTASSPATGVVICRLINRRSFSGWAWSSLADGLGRSLELVNDSLPNQFGQNWTASRTLDGTPGAPNSVATNNVAPLILAVQHYPLVPRSSDPVTIRAQLLDEQSAGVSAAVWYRNASTSPAGPWASTPLLDDGDHNDGLANDSVYGAQIPAQPNLTVVEFYVEARDATGLRRTWPAPALDANDAPLQQANAQYQVDDSVYAGNQPVYRFIMTEAERAELRRSHDSDANGNPINALYNMSFVTTDGIESLCTYNSGVRNRGAGTRTMWPMNYALRFPNDRPWKGQTALNFYARATHSYLAGCAISDLAGITAEKARVVQIRLNGINLATTTPGRNAMFGSYIEFEAFDANFAANHFPEDSNGNLYRGSHGSWSARLEYVGGNPNLYQGQAGRGYYKANNKSESDWSDLLNLCAVLNTNTPDDAVYAQAVSQVINVDDWLRQMAVFALLGSGETALQTGYGDDFAMYRGVKDPRFVLLTHDFDAVLNLGDGPQPENASLFRMCPGLRVSFRGDENVQALNRFMTNAYFCPRYYQILTELLDTVFEPGQMSLTLDRVLGDWVPANAITGMKTYATNRYNYARSVIPTALTVSHSLPMANGYPSSSSPTIALSGVSDAAKTRAVKVNGVASVWTPWQASWVSASIALQPGLNRIVVQAFDDVGQEIERRTLDVWYNRAGETVVAGGALAGNTTWSPAGGPYRVNGNLTIPSGSVLTIQPGTTVYFDNGAGITVNGQLIAKGTETQRIRFTRVPGGTAIWAGFQFTNARQANVLAYADMEYAGSRANCIEIHNSQVLIDRMTFFNIAKQYLEIWEPQVTIRHSVFGDLGQQYLCKAEHMLPDGWFIVEGNLFGNDQGDNDIFHLNRVSVKNGPVAQILNNVFTGAGDDIIDDNETDSHIEGNLFMNFTTSHPARSAAAAVTTGDGGSTGVPNVQSQHLTVVRNVFYGNDYGILNKDGSYVQVYNCVFVNNRGAIVFDEPWRMDSGPGRGCYIESSIFWNNWPENGLEQGTFAFLTNTAAYRGASWYRGYTQVTVNNSILPAQYHYLGTGNLDVNPRLVWPTNFLRLSPTNAAFATGFDGFDGSAFLAANRLVPDMHPQVDSPALGAGFNGTDLGVYASTNATIRGEPDSPTAQTKVALTVGGTDLYGYKYRVQGAGFSGAWSAEQQAMQPVTQIMLTGTTATATVIDHGYTNGDRIQVLGADSVSPYFNGLFSITNVTSNTFDYTVVPGTNALANETPPKDIWCRKPESIQLSGLANGTYTVEVLKKNSMGVWQDEAAPTVSRSWTVNGAQVDLRFSEILAKNEGAVPVNDKLPDLIELYNGGSVPMNLAGFSITDSKADPRRFVFPAGVTLGAQQYLVVNADNEVTQPGFHLGFALSQQGEMLYLFDARGQLLDAVAFGLQLPNLSIGRLADGQWRLTQPTFGSANIPASLGDPRRLKINEWLAHGTQYDFIELYNPDPLPVELSGLSLADNAQGAPRRHQIAPLSFIAGGGLALFYADKQAGQAASQLSYKLAAGPGVIGLFDRSFSLIDLVRYGSQTTDVSQGRSPNGSQQYADFAQPTPGGGNAGKVVNPVDTNVVTQTFELIPMANAWKYYQAGYPGDGWQATAFTGDSAWPAGAALLYVETSALPAPKNTPLTLGKNAYYFRTHFQVQTNLTGATLNLSTIVDDGAVYYLNGKEVFRLHMPEGPVTYDTFAQNNESALEGPFAIPLTNLVPGDNVMAVEVHQVNTTSSDIVFGMSLYASYSITNTTTNLTAVTVLLNEVFAHNMNPVSSNGVTNDWVELYNPSDAAIDIGGLSLTDDLGAPRKWIVPSSFKLPANGYRVIACNGAALPSSTNTGFALNAAGGGVYVYDSPNRGGALLDSLVYGLQPPDLSVGRVGLTGAWSLNQPTPGLPNQTVTLADASAIRINEWMANPTLGEDWFELYNPAAQPVDLSGFYLTDDLTQPERYRIPALSFLGSGASAYRKFSADNSPAKGANHTNFKLSREGSALGVFGPNLLPIDLITYGLQAAGVSQGRFPDGSGNIVAFTGSPTPGAPNALNPVTDSDGDGLPDDWERTHGLNPNDPSDAATDSDQDGLTNLQEYAAGTDPNDPSSTLALSVANVSGGSLLLHFVARAGRTYTVLYREDLLNGQWLKLSEVPAPAADTVIEIRDGGLSSDRSRFYRLVTPKLP